MMKKQALRAGVVFWALTAACMAGEPVTVFVVRHAEKELVGDDPNLNPAGRERAQLLDRMLSTAGVTGLYATRFQRTQETLKPLSERLGLGIGEYDDLAALLERIRRDHSGEAVAVAGHSNTVPQIVQEAGAALNLQIPENQYDDLIVLRLTDEGAEVIHLKYGRQCPCQ